MSKLIKVGILISGKLSSTVKRVTDSAVSHQGRVGSAIKKVNTQFGNAREARKYGRLLNDLKKKQRGLDYSSERLDKGIEDVERRYHEARRAASRYGAEIGEVERETRKLGDTQKRQSRQFSKADIGRAVGAAGGAAIGAGLYGAANREEAGFYLGTVINSRDGDKDAAVERSRVGARAFARKSLADESEIIDIEYALNSAGLEEGVSRAGARMVHKVAKITKGQSGEVGEIIGTTFNNLGNQMVGTAEEKMTRIGNILTKTQFKFQIRDFGQLGASMEYGLATAASYKIGLEETAATIGFLNSAGFQGTRAGTTFAAVMRSMTKAGDELGFSMVRNADGSLDFMATVSALSESLDGLDTDEKADLIGKLFGDEGKGGVIAMINDVARLKDGIDDVTEAGTSTLVDDKYSEALKLSISQWTMLRQNIGQTAVTIGTSLLPVVNAVLTPVSKFMTAVAWGIENIPGMGLAIGIIGTVVIGTAMAMGAATAATWAWNAAVMVTTNRKILWFVGALTKGLWGFALRAAPAAVIGLRAIGTALLLNPIGLAITAIAVGAFLLIKFWKPISGFFGRLFGGVGDSVKGLWTVFKTVFKWSPLGLMMAGLGGALRWLVGAIKAPGEALRTVWQGLKIGLSWSPLGLIKQGWSGLPTIFKGSLTLLKEMVGNAVKFIGQKLMKPITVVQGLWDKIRGVKRDASGVKVGGAIENTKTKVRRDRRETETVTLGETRTVVFNQTTEKAVNQAETHAFNTVRNEAFNDNFTRNQTDNKTRNHVETLEQNETTVRNREFTARESREERVQIGRSLNRLENNTVNETDTTVRDTQIETRKTQEETLKIGQALNRIDTVTTNKTENLTQNKTQNSVETKERLTQVGEIVNRIRNETVNDTQNRVRSIRVGKALNDNQQPIDDIVAPRVQPRYAVGSAYGALNAPEALDLERITVVAPGAQDSANAPKTPTETHHHSHAGDTNTFHFYGVLDGAQAAEKLRPHLSRLEREKREGDLHD